MALLQASIIALVALAILPGQLFYFDVTPKLAILLAGVAFCGLGLRLASLRKSPFSLLLVAAFLSLTVSTLVSTNRAISLYGSSWRRYGLVAQTTIFLFAWLLAQNTAGRRDRARTILRGIALSASLTAVYGILQYFGWDPLLPSAGYHIGEGIWTIVRPPGTLGYVSYFATWLLCAALLSFALAAWETDARWRVFAYSSAAVCSAAMLLTGTRGALVGLAAAVLVWLYARGFRVGRRALAIAAVLLVSIGAFYFSPAGWNLRSRTRWFVEDPWGGARPGLWRDSLRMAAHRLPLGYGPEVFRAEFPRFTSRELAHAFPDFAHESPHNMFLDVLVAQGLPGFLCLAALCLLGLRTGLRGKNPWIPAALAGAIVSQQFIVFTIPTALIFFTILALAEGEVSEPIDAPVRSVFFLPVAAALLFLAFRFTASDHALALSQKAIDANDPDGAAAHYAVYDRTRLPGTTADLWYSRALLGLAEKANQPVRRMVLIGLSGGAALRATTTAEDPFNAWYNLASLYAIENNAAETERCLRRAIDADPNWFKPHWTLAQLLRLRGRVAEAASEAALAADLDAGKDPEVARTLLEIRALQK